MVEVIWTPEDVGMGAEADCDVVVADELATGA